MSIRVLTDPAFRRKVAGTDPRIWVMQPAFWLGQPALLVTLGTSLVGVLLLAPFTYSGAASLLSLLVQALAAWGVVIAARALAAADVDLALVRELEERGSAYLSGLAAQGAGQMDLARLERTLVPSNPAIPPPGPIRLFQQVCKEARDRRFESASVLVQPYRDEATEAVFRLQNLQKLALWLGILGTFVGLLLALRHGGANTPGAGDAELSTMVQQMFGGLSVSFTASVAGLEVAIILGFALLLLRKRQELCFAQLETAAVTLLSAARHAVNRDEFMAEFTQVTTAVRDLTGRVYEQTRELAERLNGVDSRLREQNERIDAGMERLAGARGEFDRFLREASEAEHAFIRDLAELFEAASFRDLARAIRDGARQAGEQLSERLDASASRNAEQMEAFNASVQGLAAAVQAQSAGFGTSVDRLQREVVTAAERSAETIQAAHDRLSAVVAQRAGERVVTDSAFETLAARLVELNRSVGRLGLQRPRGVRDLLTSIASRWLGTASPRQP
jgi:hypothetical protein